MCEPNSKLGFLQNQTHFIILLIEHFLLGVSGVPDPVRGPGVIAKLFKITNFALKTFICGAVAGGTDKQVN